MSNEAQNDGNKQQGSNDPRQKDQQSQQGNHPQDKDKNMDPNRKGTPNSQQGGSDSQR